MLVVILAALQAGLDEAASDVGDFWIGVVMGVDDRRAIFARQRHEIRGDEAVMPYLESVAQRNAVLLVGQQLEKPLEIVGVELFRMRELPEDRPKLVAQLADPRAEEL